MLVMTVAPQKDICPHGKTYPRKAIAMTTPGAQKPHEDEINESSKVNVPHEMLNGKKGHMNMRARRLEDPMSM